MKMQANNGNATLDNDSNKEHDTLLLPTLEQWRIAFSWFRAAIKENYPSDAKFCERHDLSKGQFSRVIRGLEKPSDNLARVFHKVFPERYKMYADKWAADFKADNIEEFSEEFPRQVWGHDDFPGDLYVISTKELESESDVLLELAARFLENKDNKIHFIMGDALEDWQYFQTRQSGNHLPMNQWEIASTQNLANYVNELVRWMPTDESKLQCEHQVKCYRIKFLDMVDADADINKLGIALAAFQVLNPLIIYMLYMGRSCEPVGSIFVRSGSNYVWLSLSSKDAEALFAFITGIKDLSDKDTSFIKEIPIYDISPLLRRIKDKESNK